MSVRKRRWKTASGEVREAWLVDYLDQDGKRHVEQYPRKKDAEDRHHAVHVEIRRGTYVAPDAPETLHQRVKDKWADFLERDIEPAAYLYRHYHHEGDLLYVGVSLSPLARTKNHFSTATWRDFICVIVIEPFATREQALEAEQNAIRTEFPKHNTIHNGQRHPLQELARLQRRGRPKRRDEHEPDQNFVDSVLRRHGE